MHCQQVSVLHLHFLINDTYKGYHFLGHDTMQSGRSSLTFQRNILALVSGSESKPNKEASSEYRLVGKLLQDYTV
jgi:hypothetical protein